MRYAPPIHVMLPVEEERIHASFTVDVMNSGRIRVTDHNGNHTFHTNSSAIGKTLADIRRDIHAGALDGALPTLINEGVWHFPSPDSSVSALPLRGACVYFAFDPIDQTTIKIGRTIGLRKRMKSLNDAYSKRPFKVLAYCFSESHVALELALHAHFREHLKSGTEYFHMQPVYDWLKSFHASKVQA